jgi:hypothetical protein
MGTTNHHNFIESLIENEYYKSILGFNYEQHNQYGKFKKLCNDGLEESVKKYIFILNKVNFEGLILLRGATLAKPIHIYC